MSARPARPRRTCARRPPPAEAVLVAQQSGTNLLVARFGLSTSSQIDASKRRLAQNGVLLKGVILNAVKRKASTSPYDSGAYGYYTYTQQA